jgi:hypothetical protein
MKTDRLIPLAYERPRPRPWPPREEVLMAIALWVAIASFFIAPFCAMMFLGPGEH